jgi:hypothetical protein
MSIMITHTAAAVVTRHCSDLTVVGGAAATFSVGGSRPKVLAWSAGGNLTQFDADAYVLARTAEEITHTYTDKVPPPDNIFIFSNLASALQAVKNPCSIKAHSSALRFHRALTTFTLRHSHVAFYLIWSPADGDLEGFQMASTWAAAACLHDPPNGLYRVQSAAFQKDRARARAFQNWEVDFHQECCISDFHAAVTGTPTNRHHTHTSSLMGRPPTTTHSGLRLSTWRKTQGARKPNAPSTPAAPPPPHYNLQWTTPSPGLTLNSFALRTLPKHSHAPVAPPSVLHNISHGNAHYSIKPALITQSTPMGVQSLILPSITPTPTNYSRSSKIAVLHRVLLTLAPQRK